MVAVLLLGVFALIVYRWISLERWHWRLLSLTGPEGEWVQPEYKIPTPKPTRPPIITGKLDTRRIFNGLTLNAELQAPKGGNATEERVDPQSYAVDLKLRVRVPKPNETIEELAKVNPELPKLLPDLGEMVKTAKVAPFFAQLYENKVKGLRADLGRLDQVLSRHNFYDCETVLQLEHPKTHRKAILLQADMDVDADGSDSDRLPIGSGVSTNFKPFTSFKWAKKTKAPNPYLPATQSRLEKVDDEYSAKGTSAERKRELKATRAALKSEIDTLKKFSFLIGATDPYIVIPMGFASGAGGRIGDYAVVIAGGKIYPAVVGDAGPSDKVGEASLRIAKEINTSSTAYNRPVSDLGVSYLIFPGTADKSLGPPDLAMWGTRCQQLVDEIGGASVPLHQWENILPTPTPTPTPTPSPTETPAPSPSASASPETSPSPPSEDSPSASPSATFAFPISSPSPSETPTASAGPSVSSAH